MSSLLIVHDSSFVRAQLASACGARAGRCTIGVNTNEALTLLTQFRPDAVALDCHEDANTEPAHRIEQLLSALSSCAKPPLVFALLEEGEHASVRRRIPMANYAGPAVVVDREASPSEFARIVDVHLPPEQPPPFSVAEYLQVACLGGHSLRMGCRNSGGDGQIVVWEGSVWSAYWRRLTGFEAFAEIVHLEELELTFVSVTAPPDDRQLAGSCQELLIEAARLRDEANPSESESLHPEELDFSDLFRSSSAASAEDSAAPLHLPRPDPLPVTLDEETRASEVGRWIERGVQAVIARRYEEAVYAFEEALKVDPNAGAVRHRLDRLYELGYSSASYRAEEHEPPPLHKVQARRA